MAAFGATLGDAGGFGGVELGELVVEFDPVGEGDVTEAHGDEVLRAVAEGAVGEGFRCCYGPVGVGWWGGRFEGGWGPCSWFALVFGGFVEGRTFFEDRGSGNGGLLSAAA